MTRANPRRGGNHAVRWQRIHPDHSAWLFVPTKANPQQVGRPASVIKAKAMVTLTIKLKMSYKQLVQVIVLLLMLFPG